MIKANVFCALCSGENMHLFPTFLKRTFRDLHSKKITYKHFLNDKKGVEDVCKLHYDMKFILKQITSLYQNMEAVQNPEGEIKN